MSRYKIAPVASSETSMFTQNTASRISDSVMSHIMTRLNNIYDSPIQGAIRETFSNAYDAVKKNGSGEIRILTPKSHFPFYVIEDTGTGMSLDIVNKVHIHYGETTKDEDFNQIGSYGLGSKAPLSLSNEYSVETICDGQKISYTILSNNGAIEATPRIVENTDLPNGTKVTIPIGVEYMKKIEEFNKEIQANTYYCFDVPVYIDDVLVDVKYEKVDSILLYEDDSESVYGDLYISNYSSVSSLSNAIYYPGVNCFNYVLGGSFYNSNDKGSNYAPILVKLVPGLVDFNSSRDKIQRNERLDSLNKMVITQIEGNEGIVQKIYEKINSQEFPKFLRELYMLGAWEEDDLKSLNFDKFIHSETGISFSEISEVSKKAKAFIIEFIDRGCNKIATQAKTSKADKTINLNKISEYSDRNFHARDDIFGYFVSSPSVGHGNILFIAGLHEDITDKDIKKALQLRNSFATEKNNSKTICIAKFDSVDEIKVFRRIANFLNIELNSMDDIHAKVAKIAEEKQAKLASQLKFESSYVVLKNNETKDFDALNYSINTVNNEKGYDPSSFTIILDDKYDYYNAVRHMIMLGELKEGDHFYLSTKPTVAILKALNADKVRSSSDYKPNSKLAKDLCENNVRSLQINEIHAKTLPMKERVLKSIHDTKCDLDFSSFEKIANHYGFDLDKLKLDMFKEIKDHKYSYGLEQHIDDKATNYRDRIEASILDVREFSGENLLKNSLYRAYINASTLGINHEKYPEIVKQITETKKIIAKQLISDILEKIDKVALIIEELESF